MNSNFSIQKLDNLTIVRLLDDLNLTQILAVIDEVALQDDGNHRIWDLTKCFSFTSEQIRQIAEHAKRKWTQPSKVAYIATDDLAFGLLRMFEIYRDDGSGQFQTMVFRNEADALAWFGEDAH